MSGSDRPRRTQSVNYEEPGDYPDESQLEESLQYSSAVVSEEASSPSIAAVGGSIGEPLLASSPRSSVVEEEATNMAALRANQLTAELEAAFFQLKELVEEVETDFGTMNISELTSACAELKEFRVQSCAVVLSPFKS